MKVKKGRAFLIGGNVESKELTKDDAIKLIDDIDEQTKDELLKIFKEIDPKQAQGITQLGVEEYIKYMIELTSRKVYADDGKAGTDVLTGGVNEHDYESDIRSKIEDAEEETTKLGFIRPTGEVYDDIHLYDVTKDILTKEYGYKDDFMDNVEEGIYEDNPKVLAQVLKYYNDVNKIITNLHTTLTDDQIRELYEKSYKHYNITDDEPAKSYHDRLIRLIQDQVSDTLLNAQYAISHLHIDKNRQLTNTTILKLSLTPELLNPRSKEGDDQRTKVWKEQHRWNPTFVDDSNSYFNEIQFRNKLTDLGLTNIEASTELCMLTSEKFCPYDIKGDNFIGDIKGCYREGYNNGHHIIGIKKMLNLINIADTDNKEFIVIGWPPITMSREDTRTLRIDTDKNQEYFNMWILNKKEQQELKDWYASVGDKKRQTNIGGIGIQIQHAKEWVFKAGTIPTDAVKSGIGLYNTNDPKIKDKLVEIKLLKK